LDIVLNELFDVYYEALKMGSLTSFEPLDKVVTRIAETRIVDPVTQENPISSTLRDYFWKRSYSIITTVSESEQSNRSESINRSESSNRILKI
jgi:hypothetical protein